MIVPRTSDRQQQPQGPQPSEEMMLMALAHMKDIGRIPPKGQGEQEPEELTQSQADKALIDAKRNIEDMNIHPRLPELTPDEAENIPGRRIR